MNGNNASTRRLFVGLSAVLCLLAACSAKFTYPNTLAQNLRIQTETDSGSPFSSVHAALGIYQVDAQCKIEYRGTVDLDDAVVTVGIPSGKPSYLVFEFAGSSFLGSSRHSVTYETLLVPAQGYDYRLDVSYVDDIYNVEIHESRPGETMSRRIARRDLRTCSDA